MGIPSYFAYLVRNHRSIIKKLVLSPDSPKINNLYLDCNSFIYEAHHRLPPDPNFMVYETNVIKDVFASLIKMIRHLQPNQRLLIAFDGVAPLAKLNQQRNRRYMTAYQNSLNASSAGAWNTAAITPGTAFMQKLGESIRARFANPMEFGLQEIIVSSADEPGEGEHKIYEYIREHPAYHRASQTIIYGLDADLIMLTLNHLHVSENLYLYRETPEFIKHIDKTLNPNENYLLDIPLFAKIIIQELAGTETLTNNETSLTDDRLFDYILLCFFLGNDFLPHFPALNIRTTGIENLINAYKFVFSKATPGSTKATPGSTKATPGSTKATPGSTKATPGSKAETLTKDRQIIWKNMRKFIAHLAAHELEYIQEEYVQREKQSKRLMHGASAAGKAQSTSTSAAEDENLLLPLKERAHELYINPNEAGWETRYYKILFNTRIDDDRRKDICTNYLEGLEWTMKYYSTGCADWRWLYHYAYPPLLTDLIQHVPYFDHTFVPLQPKQPVAPLVQLCYVLPPSSMGLLPHALYQKLLKEQPDWYVVGEPTFLWAFCKFFWEAHVELPQIELPLLEALVLSEVNK
jgi:5'-3' exoribonuclease 2